MWWEAQGPRGGHGAGGDWENPEALGIVGGGAEDSTGQGAAARRVGNLTMCGPKARPKTRGSRAGEGFIQKTPNNKKRTNESSLIELPS